jgi:uncharacterized membrane protein YhaH (DUF805 family)
MRNRQNPEEDDRFAPRDFGDSLKRFEAEPRRESPGRGDRKESAEAALEEAEELEIDDPQLEPEPEPRNPYRSSRRNYGDRSPAFLQSLVLPAGRATRRRYWAVYFALFAFLAMQFASASLFSAAGQEREALGPDDSPLAGALFLLLSIPAGLLLAWIHVVTTVRRYHDRGKSGVWMLLLFIPVASFVVLIECGFLPGTPGPNEFGPDPRES